MSKELLLLNLFMMLLVYYFLIKGIRKLNGHIFFQESNQMILIYTIITVLFEIKKMDFSPTPDYGYGVALSVIYLAPLLIIAGGAYFNMRKKTIIIYDTPKEKLIQIVKDVFLRYRMIIEQDQESGENLQFQVRDMNVTVKLSEGSMNVDKWTIEIINYRKLYDLALIVEDMKNAVYEEDRQRKRFRGMFDFLFGIAIFCGIVWFNLKFSNIF